MERKKSEAEYVERRVSFSFFALNGGRVGVQKLDVGLGRPSIFENHGRG